MSSVLIADSGSTKTHWSLLSVEKDEILRYSSEGLNPLHLKEEKIYDILKRVSDFYQDAHVSQIFFFGAGCVSDKEKQLIKNCLYKVWKAPVIEVESDMLGAGRALLGDSTGIACILGTGSNSALFENGKIHSQIPALGYVLGDEGSGAALGKRLLNGIFKQQFSKEIRNLFFENYPLSLQTLIEKVYKTPNPSAFLASFSPFLLKNRALPEIRHLIVSEFSNFFVKNITPYHLPPQSPIGFVGSVAEIYKDFLCETAKDFNFKVVDCIKDPVYNLEKYYIRKFNLPIKSKIE